MDRRAAGTLVVALIGGVAWGCAATGGASLSSTRYTADDLAEAQYDNLYDFLRAHNRVRVGQSGSSVPIRVRRRAGAGMSMEGAENAPGGFSTGGDGGERSLGGGLGSSSGSSSVSGSAGGSDRYVPSRLYIDDREVGAPIPRLRQLRPEQVESLKILRPSEASSRYGGSGDFGVVSILLRKGGG